MKNSKRRTAEMRAMALKIVKIRPMSDEAEALIGEALAELGLPEEGNRTKALKHLAKSGRLKDVDLGGEIVNEAEAEAALMDEFGCVRQTARTHVQRAGRLKRFPDWRPPEVGGRRPGAGAPFLLPDQICAIREASAKGESYRQIAKRYNCSPSTVGQIVRRETHANIECGGES